MANAILANAKMAEAENFMMIESLKTEEWKLDKDSR